MTLLPKRYQKIYCIQQTTISACITRFIHTTKTLPELRADFPNYQGYLVTRVTHREHHRFFAQLEQQTKGNGRNINRRQIGVNHHYKTKQQ